MHGDRLRRRSGDPSPMARRSALIQRFMTRYFRRVFTRHLNALRLASWGSPAIPEGAGPLVIYSNHPAWWDAALYVLVADQLFPEFESFAPMDAEMLEKYGVLARIGAFGVDLNSARGAAAFLAASHEIVSQPHRALWITAQGRFSDIRERPLALKPGIARLAELAPDCLVLPLAIEYSFWLERGSEAFIAFGPPMPGRDLVQLARSRRLAALEAALTATLDRLSTDVQTRDPGRFHTLIQGRAGVGGVYDQWRRIRAALRRRTFDPRHERPAS